MIARTYLINPNKSQEKNYQLLLGIHETIIQEAQEGVTVKDLYTQVDEGAEARRREHQKELARKKQSESLERYSESTGDQNGVTQKKFKRFKSYKRDNQFPSRVKDLVIVVDQKAATVVLPIMGRLVPFHNCLSY
ncbi:FACT complex subunit spt16 [Schaereria dolodes]|nr:FACT complex subunit spt16 [Schaereria dolodes]